MKYFFDTFAIIEIIRKNKNYEKYLEENIITSILNLGELYYILLREKNEKGAEEWHKRLSNAALTVSAETVKKAMRFKFENKNRNFSFIDCVGYALAEENGLIFLTGDKEFENISRVEFVK